MSPPLPVRTHRPVGLGDVLLYWALPRKHEAVLRRRRLAGKTNHHIRPGTAYALRHVLLPVHQKNCYGSSFLSQCGGRRLAGRRGGSAGSAFPSAFSLTAWSFAAKILARCAPLATLNRFRCFRDRASIASLQRLSRCDEGRETYG